MKKPALKIPAGSRSMLVEVIEFLKKGPLTAAHLPHIRGMKHVIYALRIKGWPIATEIHPYFDQFGVAHDRAEYRLVGNWTEQALPFGGIKRGVKTNRKPRHPAAPAGTAGDEQGSSEDPSKSADADHLSPDAEAVLPFARRSGDGAVLEEAPGRGEG